MDEQKEPPSIDYAALMRQSILDVVRQVMSRAADEGLPGEHHFYLTFATGVDGVEMPRRQRQQFPEEMTVVIQHQFWNLAVDEVGFAVTLRFGGKPERLRVPWPALRVFADPSVGFALKLPSSEAAPAPAPTVSAAPAAGSPLRAVDGPSPAGKERPSAPGPAPEQEASGPPPAAATTGSAARPDAGSGDGKVVQIGTFRRRPGTDTER